MQKKIPTSYLLWFLCLIFSFIQVFSQNSETHTTFFRVRESSALANAFQKSQINDNFYYHDIDLTGHPINLNGVVKLNLKYPIFLLHANEEQTPFLIYPGENINVNFDSIGKVTFSIEGNVERTNELYFFPKLIDKTDNITYYFKTMPFIKKISSLQELENLEKIINGIKIDRLNFLKSYSITFPVSSRFKKIAETAIVYAATYDSLNLYCINKEFLRNKGVFKQKITTIAETYRTRTFENMFFSNRALAALISSYVCGNCNCLFQTPTDFINQANFILENFSGPSLEYLSFKTLYDGFKNNIPMPSDAQRKLFASITDSLYISEIQKVMNSHKPYAFEHDAIVNAREVKNTIRNLLAKYKGNVILIDIWATWCAPCRAEIPYSKKLKEMFRLDSVKLIYLSTDEDFEEWFKVSSENDLGHDNYLILNPGKFEFAKIGNNLFIPKYLLFNKKGQLVNDDAPRPSDPKLIELLKQLVIE